MTRVWSEQAKFESWLAVELAVLDAWAQSGTIPADAARVVRDRARLPTPEQVAERERTTNHDVAAFVDTVAAGLGEEGRWFHYGLTSSDVLDTALSLTVQAAGELVLDGVERAIGGVDARAAEHRATVMIGRTHGVHAEPTTFGLKLVGWAFQLERDRDRIEHALAGKRVGKLSGAVGTYATTTPEVERVACEALGLDPAPSSTQILQRDRHAELLAALAVLASSLDRFALEIRHLARTEVREVGRGRLRCRTSEIRSSPSASAVWLASSAGTRSSEWRTSRCGTSATSRIPRPSASRSRTHFSPSTTCSIASHG
jgi:adenylosuccinate lyase